MNSPFFTFIIIVVFWVLSSVNFSGWGLLFDTPTKTFYLIGVLYFICKKKTHVSLPVYGRNYGLFCLTIISFVILPILIKDDWDGFTYLLTTLLVYVFSQQKITTTFIAGSSFVVASLGVFVLFVYSYLDMLSGWNDNAISMLGLFSYLFYSVSLFGNVSGRKLILGMVISVFFIFILISKTESRGVAIFILLSVYFAYRPNVIRHIVSKEKFVKIAVSVPMVIAIFVVTLGNLTFFKYLNKLSLQNYDKTIFNGRDEIWMQAFQSLSDEHFLGCMEININYHNSAVAALAVYGIIGYCCWHVIFLRSLTYIRQYISDNIVLGCFMSFILIYWQQSLDLGFIMGCPNYIPYMILGLAFGRINTLKRYGYC